MNCKLLRCSLLRQWTVLVSLLYPVCQATWIQASTEEEVSLGTLFSDVRTPLLLLSSKTPYYFDLDETSEEDAQCRLLHISYIGRHGSRHGTKLDAAERLRQLFHVAAKEAQHASRLTTLGLEVIGWLDDMIATETPALGLLTEGGISEVCVALVSSNIRRHFVTVSSVCCCRPRNSVCGSFGDMRQRYSDWSNLGG
jgi:hypothetical protein